MRRDYISPDLETVKFTLKDVILSSPTEATIPEEIVDPIDDGGSIEL